MIQELDTVALTVDLPEYGLTRGDIGYVVLVHQEGKAYEVEFMTLEGNTIAVTTLLESQVRAVQPREIAHARAI
ncbi:MAG: DUF4926 domain-containing protein [Candidatus Omnitrophota bacterium]